MCQLSEERRAGDFTVVGGVLEKYTGSGGKVFVPQGITVIGDSAFSGRSDIIEAVLPDGVTEIGPDAFESCDHLSQINLPDGLQVIGEEAFWCCQSLEHLHLPETLISLGQGAFYDCPLRELYLPPGIAQDANLLLIGDRYVSMAEQDGKPGFEMFTTDSLEWIRVSSHSPAFSSVDGVLFDREKTQLFCFPPMKVCTEYTVADSVAYIETDAFYRCKFLRILTMPKRLYRPGIIRECPNLTVKFSL